MIKPLQFSAIVLGILTSAFISVQAETVEVSIISALIPAACIPTLASGGIVDYGDIAAGRLSPDTYTPLEIKQIGFSIACDAPVKVAITSIPGRPNSLAGASETATGVGLNPVSLFGLSNVVPVVGLGFDTDGTTKIGGYAVRPLEGSFVADGVAVDIIAQRGSSVPTTWVANTGNLTLHTTFPGELRYVSWANAGELTPVAFQVLSGTLELQAYLNKSSELDLSHAITLDGLTTIEIVYL